MTRRTLLGGLATTASLAGSPTPMTAAAATGKIKVTKLVYHRATLRWRDLLFVEVHTDAGIVGLGEGTCHARVDVVEAALRWLEPYLIGADPSGMEAHMDRMSYRLSRWNSGIIPRTAMSAIDIAFWDIEGKRLGVPVWRLLGGPIQNRYRAYYTHWNADIAPNTPEAYAARAVETVKNGWTAVKFSAPARSLAESDRIAALTAILSAIRKAVGDKLDIGLEFSESLTVRTAVRMAEALAPYHPLFLEEPLPRVNLPEYGELSAKSPVPIATGEGQLSRFEFWPLLEQKGASIIQPDVVKCGGVTEIRKIANMAEVYGVEVAPHQCYGPIAHVASLASMSVCHNFLIHEWEAADDKVFQEMTNGTYPVQKDGYVSLPERSGLGIEVNFAEFVKRFPFKNLGAQAESRY
jgi:galactonate dehydratase